VIVVIFVVVEVVGVVVYYSAIVCRLYHCMKFILTRVVSTLAVYSLMSMALRPPVYHCCSICYR